MYPKPLQNLIDLFAKFPGVGPRQATRLVFFLLKQQNGFASELQYGLAGLSQIRQCKLCFRTIDQNGSDETLCILCKDPKRDHNTVAVVEKESDMQSIENTHIFHGLYHVLDGVVSPLDPESPKRLHLRELHSRITKLLEHSHKAEIILATGSTTEGDTTALYIDRILTPLKTRFPDLTITRLGRGLSLGSELEYADEITLKSALTNRK
ncbi:MAG: recombination protein RecR [Candidatus Sungbacteria bacterium]|nr:recombination protein RecR [Candidatus Sungbacteria bacterium]